MQSKVRFTERLLLESVDIHSCVFLSINSCGFRLRKGITLPRRKESPSTGIHASFTGWYIVVCWNLCLV